jgi:hypothetical protein
MSKFGNGDGGWSKNQRFKVINFPLLNFFSNYKKYENFHILKLIKEKRLKSS